MPKLIMMVGVAIWYLIEFDGIQHYDSAHQFCGIEETFEKIKTRDSLKNKWCEEKRIPLIRIPYTKLETLSIEDLLLETSKYIMKGKVM